MDTIGVGTNGVDTIGVGTNGVDTIGVGTNGTAHRSVRDRHGLPASMIDRTPTRRGDRADAR